MFHIHFSVFARTQKEAKNLNYEAENMFYALMQTFESHFRLTWAFMLMCAKQYDSSEKKCLMQFEMTW